MCNTRASGSISQNEENIITQPNGERPHFTPEHFHDPTPATREAFNASVERLQGAFPERITTLQHDHINGYVGDFVGHRADFNASIKEWHVPPNKEKPRSSASLSVSIVTNANTPTSLSELVMSTTNLSTTQPPKKRNFSYGKVSGDMTDAEYRTAITHLRATVPSSDWAWVEKARLFAGKYYDAGFLPFAINGLLDIPPSQPPVCRMKESFLSSLEFNNGMRFQANWKEANPAFAQQFDSNTIARQVTITAPTDEKYAYLAFADGTEQMLVETKDPIIFAQLSAQGIAVVDPSDNTGWAAITPEQRREGIQAPSNVLMSQFALLIDNALASGVRNA